MINLVLFIAIFVCGILALFVGVGSKSIPLVLVGAVAMLIMSAILFTDGVETTQIKSQTITTIDSNITHVDSNFMVLNSANDSGANFFAWLFIAGFFVAIGIVIAGAKASGVL
jgi:uncharacterized membrane protein